jgi:hypothetical protein
LLVGVPPAGTWACAAVASSAALSLKALVKTVVSAASPIAPPICCIVLSAAEAAPESSSFTPATAVRVIGTKVRPRPKESTTTHGSSPVT